MADREQKQTETKTMVESEGILRKEAEGILRKGGVHPRPSEPRPNTPPPPQNKKPQGK